MECHSPVHKITPNSPSAVSLPSIIAPLPRRQQELELQRKKDLELRKQRELEEQKQRELEEQRQREMEEQKKRELEEQRLREIEEQKLREIEEQRLRELEEQKQRELEEQRQREIEEQKLREAEEQRLREIEEQRLHEIEEQRKRESEEQRQREFEQQRQREFEEQRKREFEEQRLREFDDPRQRDFEDQRQHDLELQRQRELEQLRQRDLELQRQRELEKQRLAELHRQQQLELEQRHQMEEQRQREEDERRQREFEQKRRQQSEQHQTDHQHLPLHRLNPPHTMDAAQSDQAYSTDPYHQHYQPPMQSSHQSSNLYGLNDPNTETRMSHSQQQDERDMPPQEYQPQPSSTVHYMETDTDNGTPSITAIKMEEQSAMVQSTAQPKILPHPHPSPQQQFQHHQPEPPQLQQMLTPQLPLDDKPVHDAPIGPSQIFKATYSGVPVYEMICKGVAVMRRRSDSYLNATQILKVADFDKPQRTRILEREVQKGEHEKVQGGYGKYQGTWVPYERGLQLCQEYNVVYLLQPILEYQATKTSPPLAPKHITAASNRPRKPREPRPVGSTPVGTPKMKKSKIDIAAQILPKPMDLIIGLPEETSTPFEEGDTGTALSGTEGDEDAAEDMTGTSDDGGEDSDVSMDDTMSLLSDRSLSQSMTPSPTRSHDDLSTDDASDKESHSSYSSESPSTSPSAKARNMSPSSRKKHRRSGDELFHGNEDQLPTTPQRKRRTRRDGTMDGDLEGSSQAEDEGNNDGREGSFLRDNSPSVNGKEARRSNSRTRASDQDQDQDDRKSTTSSIVTATATLTASGDVLARGPHAEMLLEYFISDSPGLPTLLTQPPSDLDANVVIDEEGHTALHWAAAMAKPDVIRLLIQLGADTYRVNTDGQTALMRSVLFSNNFEQKEFITLLELLQKSIFTIDKDDQTVFHHVAITAGQRGKIHAARYYLECLLAKLANHPSELASIINVQDREGDTALTIAARLKVGGKKVVKMLLDAGADAKIRNHLGKNAEDYVEETEQAISSAVASTASAGAAAAAASVNTNGSTNGHDATAATARGASPVGPGDTTKAAASPNGAAPPAKRVQAKVPSLPEESKAQSQYPTQVQDSRAEKSSIGHATAGMAGAGRKATPGAHLQQQQQQQHSSSASSSLYKQLQEANSKSGPPANTATTIIAMPPPTSLSNGQSLTASTQNVVIPTVSDLFGQLTHSYEKDIFEKDQDIVEARNLLQGMQSEIWEGRRTILELKSTASMLKKAEEEIRELEKKIKQEVYIRQRLRLEELIHEQEEEGLKHKQPVNGVLEAKGHDDMDVEKEAEKKGVVAEAQPQGDEPTTQAVFDGLNGEVREFMPSTTKESETTDVPAPNATTEMETTATKATLPAAPLSDHPERAQPPLKNEAEILRTKLEELQKKRKERVDEMVALKSQQGTRRHEYHRLIALCCNVSMDQVDGLLQPLLTSLGEDV
ncbi:hypothetical protein EC957_006009 [Mortierella hygrophila]|uniref:HTH APSES-type domain-containing protein n=1 Tax=Mortierella hygrophila TaxID=979708 RepID=A0A9P6EYM8_9FUNG|nr:hypothetical protein EC957_006009 [Mortierella hygrophila]